MDAQPLSGDCALVGTDRSARSGCAARWAVEIARPFEWSIILGHVVEWGAATRRVREPEGNSEALEERLRFEVRDWFRRQTDGEPVSVRLSVGRPVDQLCRAADDTDAAILVVAASSRSRLEQMTIGSTSRGLIRQPPCPVAIVHPKYDRLPGEGDVVVGTDFSRTADLAIGRAAAIARRLKWRLHLIHASRPDNRYVRDEFLPQGLRRLATARHRGVRMKRVIERTREACDGVPLEPRIIDDMPVSGLCRYIDHIDADIAVLGHHPRSGYTPSVLRSVALRCAHRVQSTLVVIPTGASRRPESGPR